MLDAKVIGERLRTLRGSIPRETVAKDNQISISALAMYETGQRVPRDRVKYSLAKYYNSTIESIFFTE